eukprot:CAMPEP_0172466854 /NCGR_PEP_ID=MMETSP1065-20121228/57262_1 /TAXON_ID=265537 /ORGANISM="Amphiprora paludosa, Strain CCMP125" /LENGTH=719 /DNA_ID=CAMNT_0013223795 /DNA_START=409 /DNA_END=2568 /DNA_ORIENTATION=-
MVGIDDSESFGTGDLVPEAPSGSPDEKKPIPRRNLTEAFEALCVETTDRDDVSDIKGEKFFSPTSVMDQLEPETAKTPEYEFNLHPDLGRDLSPALISRVSLYAVIHDINKEATAMAANDPKNKDENKEELSPLVQAVNGCEAGSGGPEVTNAMIDEETWLLEAIHNRSREERGEAKACPPTFLQAMGEKEYENPVHALSGASRTQLWKPSRSWWEAKSGKNPWIEPNSHNKRWRFLWPFIHYHKFLAKCIKKLKRNGADVKHSVSPVAVFLREEVCAVSDHLAAVSLFGSDQWMECLQNFNGWTDETAEDVLLRHIRQLKLRPLNEPGDVDSPLLRSQIDEHFLKAMAVQREQLREIPTTIEAPKKSKGQPPVYPRSSASAAAVASASPQLPPSSSGVRRPRYPQQQQQQQYPNGPQFWSSYEPQQQGYGDNSSVQSGISTESGFAQPYTEYAPPPLHPQAQYQPYYAPQMYGAGGAHYQVDPHDMYHSMGPPPQHHHPGWYDPALAPYGVHPPPYFADVGAPPPASPHEPRSGTDKEEKEDHTSDATPHFKNSPQHQGYSPVWSHLVDGATQSLATPAKSSPSTPNRSSHPPGIVDPQMMTMEEAVADGHAAAQPLLLRGYYGSAYGHYGARDGYAPPSPATQFMMPPTQNNSFYYGGYPSYSPGRNRRSSPKKGEMPTPVRKVVEVVESPVVTSPSVSPSTVETSAETESLHDINS